MTRITLTIKDTGSYEIQALVDTLKPKIYDIINPEHKFLAAQFKKIKSANGENRSALISEMYDSVPAMRVQLIKMYDVFDEDELVSKENEPAFTDSLEKVIANNDWDVSITGTAVVASNGTQYLVTNLFISLGIAIVVIGILMALLFGSW